MIQDTPQNNGNNNDAMKDLAEKLETTGQELKDTYDRLLRVSAEFENYKKRVRQRAG